MKYSVLRGAKDILPDESALWQSLEEKFRKIFALFNYKEMRTPIFEMTELFTRSIGESTDIVKKEMYTFLDRKGRSLTLRPEGTAPVVRAGLENNLISPDQIAKLYYFGPMFRYERPQAGRQRQFHQAGAEVFGASDPLLDVEIIILNLQLFETIGLKNLEVDINSVGDLKCQPNYRAAIQRYFAEVISQMCEDCQERYRLNPLRILDCKVERCQPFIEKAPASVETLCEECARHFEKVIEYLKLRKINFRINNRLVRGLDYYTRTTFEIVSNLLGAQKAVSGGGRYDDLVEAFEGKPTPAVGFAIGIERVIEILKTHNPQPTTQSGILLFVATIGEEAKRIGFDLVMKAREKGIAAEMDYLGKSLKAQMKLADRMLAKYVYIVGEDELKKGAGILKHMGSSEQQTVKFVELLNKLTP